MIRTFTHSFEPASDDPIPGQALKLTIREIEDAALREVLQTPGTAYGNWSLLDGLLANTGANSPFVFKEPLGHAREVKVALSGLFGRFIARAYLEKFFNLSVFAHVKHPAMTLDGRRRIRIQRLASGDLPDWIACRSDLTNLTIAEAKGCHDKPGPEKALDRAWNQAQRIDILVGSRQATVKRIAIATRWASLTGGCDEPKMAVRDPVDEGDPIEPDDSDAIYIGMIRRHIANLIRPLGHVELADALETLAKSRLARGVDSQSARARDAFETTGVIDLEGFESLGSLIGGVVTRTGPLRSNGLSDADRAALARLDLRPVFVGIERHVVKGAIDGDVGAIRDRPITRSDDQEFARGDKGGNWIIDLARGAPSSSPV